MAAMAAGGGRNSPAASGRRTRVWVRGMCGLRGPWWARTQTHRGLVIAASAETCEAALPTRRHLSTDLVSPYPTMTSSTIHLKRGDAGIRLRPVRGCPCDSVHPPSAAQPQQLMGEMDGHLGSTRQCTCGRAIN